MQVRNVPIVENLQSGLALEDLPGTVASMKLGYHVELLGRIPWLLQARALYWCDIGTHGFAILEAARRYLPDLTSVLMDETTFLANREMWVEEKDPHLRGSLSHLTATELRMLNLLQQNFLGERPRLEQERITWNIVRSALRLLPGLVTRFSPRMQLADV